jgi:hypothetical protein
MAAEPINGVRNLTKSGHIPETDNHKAGDDIESAGVITTDSFPSSLTATGAQPNTVPGYLANLGSENEASPLDGVVAVAGAQCADTTEVAKNIDQGSDSELTELSPVPIPECFSNFKRPEVNPTAINPSGIVPTEDSTSKDIILGGVTGPGMLANKILKVDGRITHPPHGNSWKEFRCYRRNQDMGSLWELRQAWFMRGR